ncbi:hypothetical protein Q8A72_08410 [Aeribacillus pallidus]|nr:hypothetical protein [Aeribacillus pallidus]
MGSAVNPQKKLNASATRENNGLNICRIKPYLFPFGNGISKEKWGNSIGMSTADAEHIIEAVSATFLIIRELRINKKV